MSKTKEVHRVSSLDRSSSKEYPAMMERSYTGTINRRAMSHIWLLSM